MQSIVHAYWNAIHELRFQDVRELFCDTAEITWPNWFLHNTGRENHCPA